MRNELMVRLSAVQNEIEYQDIMSMTGLMNDEQLADHVEYYERKVAKR